MIIFSERNRQARIKKQKERMERRRQKEIKRREKERQRRKNEDEVSETTYLTVSTEGSGRPAPKDMDAKGDEATDSGTVVTLVVPTN